MVGVEIDTTLIGMHVLAIMKTGFKKWGILVKVTDRVILLRLSPGAEKEHEELINWDALETVKPDPDFGVRQ